MFFVLYAFLELCLMWVLLMITGHKIYLMSLAVTPHDHGKDWMREYKLFVNFINFQFPNFSCCFFSCNILLCVFSGGILSHSFELEAKQKGVFYGSPAVITFRIPTKAALQVLDSCSLFCRLCFFFIFFFFYFSFMTVYLFIVLCFLFDLLIGGLFNSHTAFGYPCWKATWEEIWVGKVLWV